MALMVLDNRMIRASGIKNIKFSAQCCSPQLNQNTLTSFDANGVFIIESVFLGCYRNHPSLVKRYLKQKCSEAEWAKLFRECTFDTRKIALQCSENIDLYNKILCLKNFTQAWLPKEFWKDILMLREEYIADKIYKKQFERYSIKLNVALPDNVAGQTCSKEEIDNAKRVFVAYSSLLNEKFIQGCGIRKVAFAKNMKRNNKTIIGGVYSNGVLCLDPTFRHLGRTILYELFLQFANNNHIDGESWKSIDTTSKDYVSQLAGQSLKQDQAETFAWLLWNPYYTLNSAKDANGLKEKINFILRMGLLSSQAYTTLGLQKTPFN